jgi:NTP pyrophosphatase (non-canonical NTP hydrolase)
MMFMGNSRCKVYAHGEDVSGDVLVSTGLFDANGVEIFDGDIIRCDGVGDLDVIMDTDIGSWVIGGRLLFNELSRYNCVVISNSFENSSGCRERACASGHINTHTLRAAIDKWGVDAQVEMVEEECIELALAIHKLRRKRGDFVEKTNAVIDEIADAIIMLEQAKLIFDIDAINARICFKMDRLKSRIEEGVA